MKYILLIIFGLTFSKLFCQSTLITTDNKKVRNINHHYFDDIYGYVSSVPKDTLYYPINLTYQKSCKIYYDINNKRLATDILFDTVNHKIISRHFNQTGNLIKEQKIWYAYYKKDYNANPLKIKPKNIEYIKTYHKDSLIYEITNFENNLLFKFHNPFTKVEFVKRAYYSDETMVCEIIWEYNDKHKLKSICNTYDEVKFLETGEEVVTRVFDCTNFDNNGCVIDNH